jgi:TatA/E family protein of Tat protein translocase
VGNIGMGEMLVILLLALLIFGPQKLPEIARNMGKALRAFQQEAQKATSTLQQAVEEETGPGAPAPGVIDHPDEPGASAAEPPAASPEASPPVDPAIRQLEDT